MASNNKNRTRVDGCPGCFSTNVVTFGVNSYSCLICQESFSKPINRYIRTPHSGLAVDTGRPCECGMNTIVEWPDNDDPYNGCGCCNRAYRGGKVCGCCTRCFIHSCDAPDRCKRQHLVRIDRQPSWMTDDVFKSIRHLKYAACAPLYERIHGVWDADRWEWVPSCRQDQKGKWSILKLLVENVGSLVWRVSFLCNAAEGFLKNSKIHFLKMFLKQISSNRHFIFVSSFLWLCFFLQKTNALKNLSFSLFVMQSDWVRKKPWVHTL